MRRLTALVALLTVVPASVASATTLEELLEQSHGSSYSAEQIISCSTPDGVRDAIVRIEQSGEDIHVSSVMLGQAELSTGSGGWTLSRQGGVVSSVAVESGSDEVEPLYQVEDAGSTSHLGGPATIHRLLRSGVLRAELTFDEATGALMAATTFSADGTTYCERRFVSFDPTDPGFEPIGEPTGTELVPVDTATALPELIAGFERLDLDEDGDGFVFAYYSDGFFSFAVFETPVAVLLADGVDVDLAEGVYQRAFTAGQVTYVWETPQGGMALVGDLPPDLHEVVLSALPDPEPPGLLRRWWRRLFG